jgi:hypothetical protein
LQQYPQQSGREARPASGVAVVNGYPTICAKHGALWPEMFDVSDGEWRRYVEKSVKVLPRYVKRSTDQVATGAQKRRASLEQKLIGVQNEQQPLAQNERSMMQQASQKIGAGEGNRTLVFSLEGCCSTIELHPRSGRSTITAGARPQPPCAGSAP